MSRVYLKYKYESNFIFMTIDNLTILLISFLMFFICFSMALLFAFLFIFKNYKKENEKSNEKLILLFEKIDFILKQQINKEELLETFFEKNDNYQSSIEGDLNKLKKDFNLIENNQQFIIKNKLNENEVKSLNETLKNLKDLDESQIERNNAFINQIISNDNKELFDLDLEDNYDEINDDENSQELANKIFDEDNETKENEVIDDIDEKLDLIEKNSDSSEDNLNFEVKDNDVNLFSSSKEINKPNKSIKKNINLKISDDEKNYNEANQFNVKLINNNDEENKYISDIFNEFKKNNKMVDIENKIIQEKMALQNNIEEDEN